MRRNLVAGALAGLTLVSPAFVPVALAQDPAAPAAAPAAEAPAAETAAPTTPATAETVLATVNGKPVTLGEVILLREQLPQQYQGLPDDVLLGGLVDQIIDQTLLAAEVSADPASDPLAVKLRLANERRASLAQSLVEKRMAEPVAEAEVQTAYDEAKAEFQPQKEFNASHILVATEDEAKAVKADLDAGGDFAAIAKEKSTDPGSGAQGGSLGWFAAGQMVPEFQAAVEALEPGKISDPVQSQFGWHVVRLDETRDTAFPALDEVKPQIENQVRQQKIEAEVAALRAKAQIDRPASPVAPSAIRQSDLLQN